MAANAANAVNDVNEGNRAKGERDIYSGGDQRSLKGLILGGSGGLPHAVGGRTPAPPAVDRCKLNDSPQPVSIDYWDEWGAFYSRLHKRGEPLPSVSYATRGQAEVIILWVTLRCDICT